MRRSVIISTTALITIVALAALLPWWLGPVASPIGARFGLTFVEYERIGYGRFALRDVEVRRPGVQVGVARVEADTPLLWLWRRATGERTEVVAGDWTVEVARRTDRNAAAGPRGWVPLRAKLEQVVTRLDRWLPAAQAGRGRVRWAGGELAIASATWSGRVLTSPAVTYQHFPAEVRIEWPKTGPVVVRVANAEHEAVALLQSTAREVMGSGMWWNQRAELSAQFGPEGWIPLAATLQAPEWTIPAARVKLASQYADVRGGGRVEWRDGQLTVDVSAEGEPREGSNAPPLTVAVRGRGTRDSFIAEQLAVTVPGVTARLTEPLEVDRTGRVRSAGSALTLEADLGGQAWFAASGQIRGEGRIEPGPEGAARAAFTLSGEGLDVLGQQLQRLRLAGDLAWPVLTVSELRVTGRDGRELAGSGRWSFREKRLSEARVHGAIGRETLARWIPATVGFEAVELEVSAEGAWPELTHRGEVRVAELQLRGLHPLAVAATWDGRGLQVANFSGEARAGETRLVAEGEANGERVELRTLNFQPGPGLPELRLTKTAQLQWSPVPRIGPLELTGGDARLAATVYLGRVGRVDVEARRVSSEWWRGLLVVPATRWTMESLTASGEWKDGPANYSADAQVSIGIGKEGAAQVSAQFAGSADGLDLVSLRVSEGEGAIAHAKGHLPIVVSPAGTPLVSFDEDARFALEASTSPNPEFWGELATLTGVDVVEPRASLNLSGTWRRPRGEALLSARRLEFVSGRFKGRWPRIEALNARLEGLNDGVRLAAFGVEIDGQLVRAEGWLPLSAERWREIREDPRTIARSGDLRVEIPDADLAALAQHFPSIVAPRGRLQADLTLKSDATVSGFLRVRNATSRPLGPLGVLQEVNADVRAEGRTLELQSVTARMGGQVVTLQGRAALPDSGALRLDFRLRGDNLPFVRRAGLLLRGDLDLTLKTADDGRTGIAGTVRLRDSLFLSDVRSLIPSGTKGRASRPPYFAVEGEPLSGWQLAVDVVGEEFLRLRTPVFNGTASARFRLEGTLGDPRAQGEAVVTRGSVRLPFATFAIRQGHVRLTPDKPEPQLFVTGQSRRFGYDVRMELSGPVSTPRLTFASSPPLDSEQVLLMVMAGQAPKSEITTTDRQRMARFGAFFGQSLLGTLGGDAGGAERLTISSGENISAQGRETYSIEYRLNDRWAVTGEYDEFDEYYGGLKWRVYPRAGGSVDND